MESRRIVAKNPSRKDGKEPRIMIPWETNRAAANSCPLVPTPFVTANEGAVSPPGLAAMTEAEMAPPCVRTRFQWRARQSLRRCFAATRGRRKLGVARWSD